MTREEAIQIVSTRLKNIAWLYGSVEREQNLEAIDMAIEALQATEHDGCEGCKYTGKDLYEMPCLMCKQSKEDLWIRSEP